MLLAAFTPTGSPSMRMMSLFSVSEGMMMDVPVSVLMRLTALQKSREIETKPENEMKRTYHLLLLFQ